jgi:glycosyltransferase involved in cell wall biosynthesis
VADFLSLFDIKVIASNTEGFPLVMLEAMMMGKPIVATAVGGIREVLTDGISGLMVPPQNPAAMAEKIVYLLLYAEERNRLGQAAKKESEKYSLERHVSKQEKIYMDMARKKLS